MKYKILLIAGLLWIAAGKASAQEMPDSGKSLSIEKMESTPFKTGLSYEQLAQFFQTTVTTGNSGGFDFKSSWFGVKKLFGSNDRLELSKYYTDHKFARNFEISLGVHQDQQGKLSTMTGGIKYAMINNRSKSDHNFLDAIKPALLKRQDVFEEASKIYLKTVIAPISDTAEKQRKFFAFRENVKKYHNDRRDENIPGDIKPIIDSIIRSSSGSFSPDFFNAPEAEYAKVAKRVDMGSLLTLSINPGYSYTRKYFDTTNISISFIKGFGSIDKPVNLDLKVQGIFVHDTLGTARNLSRQVINWTAGLNKVLANNDKNNPVIEFELQAEDYNITSERLYKDEQRHTFTMNALLRFHLSNEITLPITLKYDVKKPNLFSIFQLQWNLEISKASK